MMRALGIFLALLSLCLTGCSENKAKDKVVVYQLQGVGVRVDELKGHSYRASYKGKEFVYKSGISSNHISLIKEIEDLEDKDKYSFTKPGFSPKPELLISVYEGEIDINTEPKYQLCFFDQLSVIGFPESNYYKIDPGIGKKILDTFCPDSR